MRLSRVRHGLHASGEPGDRRGLARAVRAVALVPAQRLRRVIALATRRRARAGDASRPPKVRPPGPGRDLSGRWVRDQRGSAGIRGSSISVDLRSQHVEQVCEGRGKLNRRDHDDGHHHRQHGDPGPPGPAGQPRARDEHSGRGAGLEWRPRMRHERRTDPLLPSNSHPHRFPSRADPPPRQLAGSPVPVIERLDSVIQIRRREQPPQESLVCRSSVPHAVRFLAWAKRYVERAPSPHTSIGSPRTRFGRTAFASRVPSPTSPDAWLSSAPLAATCAFRTKVGTPASTTACSIGRMPALGRRHPSRAARRLLPCRPNPKRVRPGLGTSAFVLVPLGPGYRIRDISDPKHRRAQRSRRPGRAATPSSGDRVAQAVRDRSPSSAQLAPLHGSFWWPSRSAVDDPPAMRNQSRARSRLRLRRLEPGNSGRVPWQVHSCPSLSVPRATGGPASPFWSRSSSATRRRPRGAGTRRRRSGVCVSPGGRWSPRRSADRIGSPPAGFWIRF